MTNATHTPGPWMAAAAPSSVVGWPIIGPQGRSIANVSWMPKPPHVSDEEYAQFVATCEANARLIAAAPELLAAVEMLLPSNLGSLHADDFGDDFIIPVDMTVAEIRKARAAIAKAKGGAA